VERDGTQSKDFVERRLSAWPATFFAFDALLRMTR
jgi:hypothetical protein